MRSGAKGQTERFFFNKTVFSRAAEVGSDSIGTQFRLAINCVKEGANPWIWKNKINDRRGA